MPARKRKRTNRQSGAEKNTEQQRNSEVSNSWHALVDSESESGESEGENEQHLGQISMRKPGLSNKKKQKNTVQKMIKDKKTKHQNKGHQRTNGERNNTNISWISRGSEIALLLLELQFLSGLGSAIRGECRKRFIFMNDRHLFALDLAYQCLIIAILTWTMTRLCLSTNDTLLGFFHCSSNDRGTEMTLMSAMRTVLCDWVGWLRLPRMNVLLLGIVLLYHGLSAVILEYLICPEKKGHCDGLFQFSSVRSLMEDWPTVIRVAVLTPIREELVLRGFVTLILIKHELQQSELPSCNVRCSRIAALTSVLFGVMHASTSVSPRVSKLYVAVQCVFATVLSFFHSCVLFNSAIQRGRRLSEGLSIHDTTLLHGINNVFSLMVSFDPLRSVGEPIVMIALSVTVLFYSVLAWISYRKLTVKQANLSNHRHL